MNSTELILTNHNSIRSQARTDSELYGMWLFGKSRTTQRIYQSSIERFQEYNGRKSLREVLVRDIQDFLSALESSSMATKSLALAVIKSLFSYAQRIGYIKVNPSAVVSLPKHANTLSNRILSESEVHAMLGAVEGRDHVIIRLLYGTGVRVSELAGLSWKDVRERGDAGQITVLGKGGKSRSILISADTWKLLSRLRPESHSPEDPVFVSRKQGGHLTSTQIYRIVRDTAKQAGIEGNVSPHWLRHCHASHALDRSCPIHLVQATLGHASVATTSQYLHVRPDACSSKYIPV